MASMEQDSSGAMLQRERGMRGMWVALLALAACLLFWMSNETDRSLQQNTAKLIAGSLALGLSLGAPIGLVGSRTNARGAAIALYLFASLILVPLPLVTAGWQAALGIDGWLTAWLGGSHWLQGWPGAIWIHGIAAAAWIAAILHAGLSVTRPELEEDALLRHSAVWVLFRVTLRRALPFLLGAAVFVALLIAGEIAVTDVFQIRTLGEEVYTDLSLGRGPDLVQSASSWGLMGLLVLATPLMFASWGKLEYRSRTQPQTRLPLFGWRWCGTLLLWLAVFVFVGVPIGNLVYKAGLLHQRLDSGWHTSWSASKVIQGVLGAFWSDESDGYAAQRMWGWTLLTAGLAALTSTALAVVLTWWSVGSKLVRGVTLVIVALLAAIPGPVIGLGVIHILNRPGCPWLINWYDHSILAPWLVQTVRVMPLVILFWLPAMRSVPLELREDAALRGESFWKQLFSVAIPYQKWRVALTMLMATPLAASELAATNLVAPPGFTTVVRKIFEMIHFGIDDRLAALSLASWLLLFVVGMLLWIGAKRSR
jgi:iron(III) transport system permease protein